MVTGSQSNAKGGTNGGKTGGKNGSNNQKNNSASSTIANEKKEKIEQAEVNKIFTEETKNQPNSSTATESCVKDGN